MNRLAIIFALGLLSAGWAEAKRAAPHEIEPLIVDSIEYSAPPDPDSMGLVVARDTRSGKELWRQRIYEVPIKPSLEKDVQWAFITSLTRQGDSLVIANERGEHFTLSLQTRKVTKLDR